MNGAFNRIDKNIRFIMENSIVEFQENLEYSIDTLVKYNGGIWKCIKTTTENLPIEDSEYWIEYISGDIAGDIKSSKVMLKQMLMELLN